MEYVTREKLIDQIRREYSLPKDEVRQIVNRFIDLIIENVGEGRGVQIRGFGKFVPAQQRERTVGIGRIPAAVKIKFTMSPKLKREWNPDAYD